jgi:hypothetical protein
MTHTDAQLKEYASHHLKYDILQVRASQRALMAPNLSRAHRNALLESFAIRTRVLLEFFFDKKPGPNGARVFQFCLDGQWVVKIPKVLKPINWRASSEIAHASFVRIRHSEETRKWNTRAITQALEELVWEFARVARPELIDQEAREVFETSMKAIVIAGDTVEIWSSSLPSSGFDRIEKLDLPGPFIAPGTWIDPHLEATSTHHLADMPIFVVSPEEPLK